MATDLIENALITGITDAGFELLDQQRSLLGLFDAPLTDILGAFAVLLQTQARFIHGLKHQPGHLGNLSGLLDKLATLLALGVLEGVSAVVGKPRLQHVEVIGDARH
ncbi:hypothetical protein D3C84_428930 [compost metagenome]